MSSEQKFVASEIALKFISPDVYICQKGHIFTTIEKLINCSRCLEFYLHPCKGINCHNYAYIKDFCSKECKDYFNFLNSVSRCGNKQCYNLKNYHCGSEYPYAAFCTAECFLRDIHDNRPPTIIF